MNIYIIKQYIKKLDTYETIGVIYNNLKIAKMTLANFSFMYPKNNFVLEKVGCKK